MACGGELAGTDERAEAGRVPPRSLACHDRFWECESCGKAFWLGKHWQEITTPPAEATHH